MTPRINYFPKDLAKAVYKELRQLKLAIPNIKILTNLFETLYFVSMQTEEQNSISCYIVYISPDNPDPKPPKRIVRDRWGYTKFAKSIPFTDSNLIKLARASDPRTSAFAVYHNKEGDLYIWGLIDQANHYFDFLNYNSDSDPERPGIFQTSINKSGHIVVYVEYEKIAELKINILTGKTLNVLEYGQVHEGLQPGFKNYYDTIYLKLRKEVRSELKWRDFLTEWEAYLTDTWISALNRLILRIQSYGHGGAFLISPDKSFKNLNIKYRIKYKRLQNALEKYGLSELQEFYVSDIISTKYLNKKNVNIPTKLYLDDAIVKFEIEESRSEIDGAIWFISLLSRVDGLVLLNQQLEVEGFGVEIMCNTEPEEIFIDDDLYANDKNMRKISYEHFGTRHRSMMRYCSQYPGSLGFVISQDGEVRVMTQVKNRLVMWENIRLQREFKRIRK